MCSLMNETLSKKAINLFKTMESRMFYLEHSMASTGLLEEHFGRIFSPEMGDFLTLLLLFLKFIAAGLVLI